MTSIILEIVTIFLLTLTNGLLAMSEIAIVSSRRPRLRQQIDEGNKRAKIALHLAEQPTYFLSTVQIGITLVGILAGAIGGATISKELAALLVQSPILEPYAQALSLALVVLVITYISLVFGELAPKRLALNNPEKIVTNVAPWMLRLSRLANPLVRLLSASTDGVLRLMGAKAPTGPEVTEEEIKIMIEEGTQVGVFEPMEGDILQRVFRLGDQKVHELMTHRTEIDWLDLDDPGEKIVNQVINSEHTYFPVARGSLDNTLGIINAKDVLSQRETKGIIEIKSSIDPPLFVPENALVLDVLERFQDCGFTMALAIDEFGGLEGLLTVTDVLEAMVGELPTEEEIEHPGAVQRADGSWLLDGMLPIQEFKDIFQINQLPGETTGNFKTLAGFIMSYLGRIPAITDNFQWEGFCFEIMDLDGRRVDKVLVSKLTSGTCPD